MPYKRVVSDLKSDYSHSVVRIWYEEYLEAFKNQDYEKLSLVAMSDLIFGQKVFDIFTHSQKSNISNSFFKDNKKIVLFKVTVMKM